MLGGGFIGNGGRIPDGTYGDITVSSGGATFNINALTVGTTELQSQAVPVAKMFASATDVLFGRSTSGAGAGEEIACTALGRAIVSTSSFTAGRVLLGNGASTLNTTSNLFWDTTNNRLGIGTSSPSEVVDVRPGNSAYLRVKNTTSQYVGQTGDAILILGSATSNSSGAIQLKANYIGTELEGHQLCTRYGQNSSFRSNTTFAWMHYLVTDPISSSTINVWEQRVLIDFDRSVKFSTTGTNTTDFFIDKYGRVGIGVAPATPTGARLHLYGTEATHLKIEYAGGSNVGMNVNTNGSLIFTSSGTDSAAYYQFDKRVYMNKQSSFHAYQTSTQSNKTGNGTAYTFGTGSTLSVVTDQNSIYTTSTGTITTASGARYNLSGAITLTGFTLTGVVCKVLINVGANQYLGDIKTNPTTGDITLHLNLDMVFVASGTAITVQVVCTGEAADTVDILGGTSPIASYLCFTQVS